MRKLKNSELDRLTADQYQKSDRNSIIVLLDSVRSGNNVGSFFRTADALLIDSIVLCGITATPPNREIHKTALGAELSVPWSYEKLAVDAVTHFKGLGYSIYAVEQVEGSISLPDFMPSSSEKMVLVFGNEVKGVNQEVVDMCDNAIEIPQYGTKHSFNISVSAGIVLWDIVQKLS